MDEELRAELIKSVSQDFSWDEFVDQDNMRQEVIDLLDLTEEEAKDIIVSAFVIKCVRDEPPPVSLRRLFSKMMKEDESSKFTD